MFVHVVSFWIEFTHTCNVLCLVVWSHVFVMCVNGPTGHGMAHWLPGLGALVKHCLQWMPDRQHPPNTIPTTSQHNPQQIEKQIVISFLSHKHLNQKWNHNNIGIISCCFGVVICWFWVLASPWHNPRNKSRPLMNCYPFPKQKPSFDFLLLCPWDGGVF